MRAPLSRAEDPKWFPLTPPEGVPIYFRIAGLGGRFGALIADLVITWLAVIAIFLLMALLEVPGEIMATLAPVLFFLIRLPYFVFCELAWNGATIGKKITGLRVISRDGLPLSLHALMGRALMREAEVFFPLTLMFVLVAMDGLTLLLSLGWIVLMLAIPYFNKTRQRLGDIIAGTIVVNAPKAQILPDLAETAQRSFKDGPFSFTPEQLDHYGAFELHTLEGLLRVPEKGDTNAKIRDNNRLVAAVVERIVNKIGWDEPVRPEDHSLFLEAFYISQRAHLEQKQLFGEKRSDKFHKMHS